MAILYGTQSNGETLPVLVDQFGNLLAKGIKGEPGAPGEPGEPGEPGGAFPLPPDPYEGSILGWEDGELAWIGGSVPLPEGTYGPYVYDLESGSLDIPQDASGLVNGQQLYMSDINGDATLVKFATDTIASVGEYQLTYAPNMTAVAFTARDLRNIFAATGYAFLMYHEDYPITTLTFPSLGEVNNIPVAQSSLIVRMSFDAPSRANCSIRTTTGTYTLTSGDKANSYVDVSVPNLGELIEITFTGTPNYEIYIESITVDDVTLIDGTFPLLTFPEAATNFDKFEVDEVVQDPDVKITAINAEAVPPSITVDGGSWLGADGSGDPNGQTALDTKSFSGAGSVSYGLENRIILRNDNKEWVDDFYVTAPEQRIAARKVATTAIRKKKK